MTEPTKREPCEHCGSKMKCIHKRVPIYQLRAPNLFGEVTK